MKQYLLLCGMYCVGINMILVNLVSPVFANTKKPKEHTVYPCILPRTVSCKPSPPSVTLQLRGLVRRAVQPVGRLLPRQGKELLSVGDHVVFRSKANKTLRMGEDYSLFTVKKHLYHPKTKKLLGSQIKLLAQARIVRKNGAIVVARLVKVFEVILQKAWVGRYIPSRVVVRPRCNDLLLRGRIVGSLSKQKLLSQYQQVIVNLGRKHGLRVGNTLVLNRKIRSLRVRERLGRAIVLQVSEYFSVAWIYASRRPAKVGDRVETSLIDVGELF